MNIHVQFGFNHSHGHGHKRIQHPNVKKSSKPRTLQDTFNDLLSNIQKPLGIHHIRTILFSLPVNKGNNKITELRTILQRESQNS